MARASGQQKRTAGTKATGGKVNGSSAPSASVGASPVASSLPRILSPQAALSSLASTASSLPPTSRRLFLRAAASALVDRINFARHAGFDSYSGVRNLFAALGYKTDLTITDYRDMYRRGGIAKTIVEILPREMWAGGVSVTESEDPKKVTQFDKDVAGVFKKHAVVSRLLKADILAGLGTHSVVLIGVADKPNASLAERIPQLRGPKSILYLRQYAEDCAKVVELETEPSSERFGLPKFYELTVGSPNALGSSAGGGRNTLVSSKIIPRVHWTRIVHVAHNCLESDYIGVPDLEVVWNLLTDLLKVVGGGAEAAWRKMDQGLHINLDPEYEHATGALEELETQLEEYRHNLERDITTEGVDIKPLTSQVDKYGTNVDPILDLIAGTIRVPKRILLGSERGELASEQDRANFSSTVQTRETEYGEPLVRQLVDRLIEFGGVSQPSSGEYLLNWYEEEELDEEQKGKLLETIARANSHGQTYLTVDETRDRVYSLKPLPKEEAKADDNDRTDRENGDEAEANQEEQEEEEADSEGGKGDVQVNVNESGGIPSVEAEGVRVAA